MGIMMEGKSQSHGCSLRARSCLTLVCCFTFVIMSFAAGPGEEVSERHGGPYYRYVDPWQVTDLCLSSLLTATSLSSRHIPYQPASLPP